MYTTSGEEMVRWSVARGLAGDVEDVDDLCPYRWRRGGSTLRDVGLGRAGLEETKLADEPRPTEELCELLRYIMPFGGRNLLRDDDLITDLGRVHLPDDAAAVGEHDGQPERRVLRRGGRGRLLLVDGPHPLNEPVDGVPPRSVMVLFAPLLLEILQNVLHGSSSPFVTLSS